MNTFLIKQLELQIQKKFETDPAGAEAERNKNIRLLSGDWCLVIERSDAGVPFLPNFCV
jgi:hypothetical protein